MLISFEAKAQLDAIGISVGNNFSSQIASTLTQPPTSGIFRPRVLRGINVGIYASERVSRRWMLRGKLNFQEKGYDSTVSRFNDILRACIGCNFERLEHTLAYLSTNFTANYILLNAKQKKWNVILFLGAEANLLIKENIFTGDIYPDEYLNPSLYAVGKWNQFNAAFLFGFRLNLFEDLFGLSFFSSTSINPVLNTEDYINRDSVAGISLDVNVLKVISFWNSL